MEPSASFWTSFWQDSWIYLKTIVSSLAGGDFTTAWRAARDGSGIQILLLALLFLLVAGYTFMLIDRLVGFFGFGASRPRKGRLREIRERTDPYQALREKTERLQGDPNEPTKPRRRRRRAD